MQEDTYTGGDVLRRTQSRVFDELSRLRETLGGMGQLTQHSYDDNNNQTATVDPLNRSSSANFDALDRLIKQIDPDAYEATYAYDARDNVSTVTDQRGLSTDHVYSGLDDLLQLTSPDTGVTTHTYDASGNRTSQTNARGIVTNYHYDALNRVVQVEYPGATSLNVDYTYDTGNNRVGRLYRMQDNTGTITYYYNARGKLTRERRSTQGHVYDTLYNYDRAGNLAKITYPSGKVVQYVLNSIKQVREVRLIEGGSTTVLASGLTYRPFGGLQKLVYGNGLTLTQGWDLDYRPTNSRVLPVQDLRYFYNNADNIVEIRDIVDRSRDQDFGYDNLDRLTAAAGIYGALSYSYDGVGNRLSKSDGTNTETYAYFGTRNRIRDTTDANNTLTDYNHNATGSITKNGDDTYGYNRYERMSKSTVNSVATTYRYDGIGQRTVKTDAGGGKAVYHFETDGRLIAETLADGTTLREYIYVNGQPLALMEAGQIHYYHLNHLGTPQKITDGSQTLVWDADYKPFGEVNLTTNSVTNNLRFRGQYFVQESGLHYNYFRDYDPTTGRYSQSDPIGLDGGINTYAYVEGNPVGYFDPYGLESCPSNMQRDWATLRCVSRPVPRPWERDRVDCAPGGDCRFYYGGPQEPSEYQRCMTNCFWQIEGGACNLGGGAMGWLMRSGPIGMGASALCSTARLSRCNDECKDVGVCRAE